MSAAHLKKNKTTALIACKYYWKGLTNDVAQYVDAYKACRRSIIPRDRTLGFLYPLPILDRPWQYISIDYKSFLKDKYRYDTL